MIVELQQSMIDADVENAALRDQIAEGKARTQQEAIDEAASLGDFAGSWFNHHVEASRARESDLMERIHQLEGRDNASLFIVTIYL